MKYAFILFLILLSSLAIAETEYYQKNSLIDIKEPCINNHQACSNQSSCNITINYPSSEIFINNQPMTNQGAFYNYTLPNSTISGQYKVIIYCADNGIYGNDVFTFEINDNGRQTNDYAFIIGIGIVAAVLILIGVFISADKVFGFILKLTCFLFALFFIFLIPASFTSFDVKSLSYGLFVGFLITIGIVLTLWGIYSILIGMIGVKRGR